MKIITSAFAFVLALGAQAQTNAPTVGSGLAAPAGEPAAKAEVPAETGERDFDPAWSSNPNISAGQLAVLLPRLERQLVETRARITALTQPEIFNGDIARVQEGVPGTVPATPRESGANLSLDLSTNYSVRAGANLSTNLAVPSGPGIPPDSQVVPNVPSPADPTVAPGQRNVVVQSLDPATLSALAALQAEIERALPMVSALRRAPALQEWARNAAATAAPVQPQILTPTGRENGQPAPPGHLRVPPR